MRIGIDISPIIYGTGVSVYIKNLVEHLLKIDKQNEYVLFGGSFRRRKEFERIINSYRVNSVLLKTFPLPPTLADIIWNRLHIFPIDNLVGKIDVFHSSDWSQPPSKAFKITTIHDLVPLKFPKLSHPKIVSTHKARLKWVIREVDRIIVPSRTTGEDAARLGIDWEKIRTIPEAPDPIFKPTKRIEVEKLKRKYRIAGGYILAVGVNPRKNTQRIIEAFEKVKGEINLKLVIIGQPNFDIKTTRGVVLLGQVHVEEMKALYSGAEALIYPSLYEGFGLPILEAFVCKTPVVTSNFGSMLEVAGKAAVSVDPYSVDSITEGILKAIKERKKLVKMGLSRAKNFSWEKCAKETLKVYQEAL